MPAEQCGTESKPTRPDAIVDGRLYVRHDVRHAEARNASFFTDPANRAHLASQLLLYEHVLIPTNDFAVIPALIHWMGVDGFEEAIDCGAIGFLRRRGILGYAGNGLGVQLFAFSDIPEKPYREWWRNTLFRDSSEAIELRLKYGTPDFTEKDRTRLAAKVLANSQTPDLNKDDLFIKNVEKESYTDITDTPELRQFLSGLAMKMGSRPGDALAMNQLPGVDPNSLQIATDGEIQSPIQLVLRVAEVNMEIVMAHCAGGTDLHVSAGAEKILEHKLCRSGRVAGKLDGFARLLQLNKIPDIRTAVESGALGLPDIWKFRQHKSARLFRKWLSGAEIETAHDLERLYVESLEKTSIVESLPVRVIRFMLTTGLGFVNPAVGIGLGVADSFFVNHFLKGYRPKMMFDRLSRLFPQDRSEMS